MRVKSRLLFAVSGLSLSLAASAAAASDAVSSTSVDEVVVTAQRLDAARAAIQPQIGASTYTISAQAIQAMPGGDNAALNQVVLQAPGVAQDSFGQLHIRGEHNGLQFRLNGVILPEGLSVFSQALNPRLAGADHALHQFLDVFLQVKGGPGWWWWKGGIYKAG